MKNIILIIISFSLQFQLLGQTDTTLITIPGETEIITQEERINKSPKEKGEDFDKERVIMIRFDKQLFKERVRDTRDKIHDHWRERRIRMHKRWCEECKEDRKEKEEMERNKKEETNKKPEDIIED